MLLNKFSKDTEFDISDDTIQLIHSKLFDRPYMSKVNTSQNCTSTECIPKGTKLEAFFLTFVNDPNLVLHAILADDL